MNSYIKEHIEFLEITNSSFTVTLSFGKNLSTESDKKEPEFICCIWCDKNDDVMLHCAWTRYFINKNNLYLANYREKILGRLSDFDLSVYQSLWRGELEHDDFFNKAYFEYRILYLCCNVFEKVFKYYVQRRKDIKTELKNLEFKLTAAM